MSLREQLLKSGLASKQQAKKADREARKRQHENLVAKREGAAAEQDRISAEIIARQLEQQAADRERNRLLEEEKRQRENHARAVDIMVHHDLSDERATVPYYFRCAGDRIACLLVNELQQVQLAQGQLGIVSFDVEFKVFLVGLDNLEKIRACGSHYVLCHHAPDSAKSSGSPDESHKP